MSQRGGKTQKEAAKEGYRPSEQLAPPLQRVGTERHQRSPCRQKQRNVLRAESRRGVMLGKHID